METRPAYERTLEESQLFEHLPNEVAELIRTSSGTQYLNALAVGALRSKCTEGFFCLYEPIFVDLAARWLASDFHNNQVDIISAFSRILPFAPFLASFASQYASSRAGPLSVLAASDEATLLQLDDTTIRTLLLSVFRLLSYDLETFSSTISPSRLQSLFQHPDPSIRYLAIRCFALYMHAADAATEKMVQKYIGADVIEGEWEGIVIDYRCLGLWEERRWGTLEKQTRIARSGRSVEDILSQVEKLREYFTPRTAEVCGVLIPRLNEMPTPASSIVKAPTAVRNLRRIATALTASNPLLLVGLPNSGKTSLVNDVAATMGQSESMVTLHLNEQTDAKSLLGMYSTSPATGSFSWQPGVLTKAAREGRWILIEDLDRAPSEVIGLILPIIEKGELTIASRKERIKCAEGFKIIATMKSSYNIAGEEVAPSTTILGSRLWQRVHIEPLSIDEIQEVITQKFPLLESRVPTIMNVYQRLCSSFHGSLAIKSSQGRTPGLRDLIKLCSRMHRRLQRLGAKTGYEAMPEGAEDEIFLDVVDIFLSYIPEKSLAESLALVAAEALQISPQRAQFCLSERIPAYSDQGNNIVLGREVCRKIKVPSGSVSRSSTRFASTRAALKLMEQAAAAIQMAEPMLLVGETGIGKTTKLTVVNLSQQSESSDLLGGFKPVNIRTMAVPMLDEFNANQKFLSSVAKSVASGNWARLVHLWHEAVRLADGVFKSSNGPSQEGEEQPTKKRKLDSPKYQHLRQRWERFAGQLNDFEAQVAQGDAKFAFAFVQGKIVRALRNGEWVLLDEINLASPDTLENIASLLHHGTEGSPSVLLSEAGDVERVFGHPDFRIFGAMNPATDAGKKDLPPGLRSRDRDDLLALIQKIAPDLAQLYLETKKLSNENKLTDGAGQRPHFSIRTLVRALIYVIDHAHVYGLRRAVFEGFSMSFLTVLSQESERLLLPLLETHLFSSAKNARALLGQTPKPPTDGFDYVQFKHYWMRRGHLVPEEQPHYIITPFIEKNLKNLGPTSAGKTSMIEYLAKVSGNKFVQYLGSYGVLVEALRNGYWIVLDELNLAPSDVLEALNRLLDDNRELFIPETQEVVHPHPNFMLFATQNPAGLYGGRKVLSRAFRNQSELEFILKERSQIAPSFCARIVSVYRKLSLLRQANRLFEQKNSFATLHDREQLAINGFMAAVKSVIEEVMRVRIDEDVVYSASELEKRAPHLPTGVVWTKAMRRLFILVSVALENNEPVLLVGETGCGKTQLCQAVAEAYKRQLLIVNAHVNLETGDLIGAQRPVRNRGAIEHQLSSDLQAVLKEGEPLRPLEEMRQVFSSLTADQLQSCDSELVQRIQTNIARLNALFEWSDGSLITAMKTGQYFLLDEISLADDSVLERLNSVLEPHRSILLAEKGPINSMVVADSGFQFLSTMNPGGDYGKRELSAALRNRMTEIWAPQLSEDEDILPILQRKLELDSDHITKAMLEFAKWFKCTFQNSSTTSLSLRDLLAWVDFVNKCRTADPLFAVVQGAAMVFIDTLALHDLEGNRRLCLDKLRELFDSTIEIENGSLRVGPFALEMNGSTEPDPQFILDAPTTIANSVRIARGLQLSKPILLEGSPGVGKTTLVTALAKALGKPLTRINLSEQTDLTDLFGSDVPVEGGDVGQFTWRDAPFLQAMQRGDWVLLDEMNLASQSVLEGLNACLDHRQTVYVAELDQSFKRHPDFVLFAAQNPHHQGGGRKGLPASFVNRFTVVYADSFTDTDLKRICAKLFPGSPSWQTDKLVDFVSLLNKAIVNERRLGAVGGPWEINLRDIQRWLQLADRGTLQVSANSFLDVIISQRFRSQDDRDLVTRLYKQVFSEVPAPNKSYYHNLTPEYMQVGLGIMQRDLYLQRTQESQMRVLPRDLSVLESLMLCIEQSWPSILVGPSGCGKTTLIRKLAAVNGASLVELALSADTDTMDLIGGFEQIDYRREISSLVHDVSLFLQQQILSINSAGTALNETPIVLEIFEKLQRPDASLESICTFLTMLSQTYPQTAFDDMLLRAQTLLETTKQSDKMKVGFEWTEGVLTQAVQHGYWVILDNANLCNPSVLDRLNSLTEPNGALILNEQRTEDGSARIITPHPNFRLFLTMDSRHGELSRAMRNRCVEICFLPQEDETAVTTSVPAYTCESFLYRLRPLWNLEPSASPDDISRLLCEVCLDHLSIMDLAYLQQSLKYFLPYHGKSVGDVLSSAMHRYVSVIHGNSHWKPIESTKKAIELSRASFAIQGPSQPLHPLVNEPLVSLLANEVPYTSLVTLAHLQESKLDLQLLKQGLLQADESGKLLKPSQMSRLERSLASARIPSLMKDATQPIGSFLSDCGQAMYDMIQNLGQDTLQNPHIANALRTVLNFCMDIFRLTAAKDIDEGEFQVYLQIGRELCAALSSSFDPLQQLAVALSQALSRFQESWALKTGLSMQRLWESWRPATPATGGQLKSILDLESVASEFTNIATKTHLDLSQLSQVRNSLVNAQQSIVLHGADEGQLVQNLRQTVSELASVVQRSDIIASPYFSNEFEALCQYHDIFTLMHNSKAGDNVIKSILPLLAGRDARPLNVSAFQTQVPEVLHRLALYSGSEHSSTFGSAISGTLSLSLLEKLTNVGVTILGQMDSLEVEKQTLSKALALSSWEIAMDQHLVLRQVSSKLAMELVIAHKEFFEPQSLEKLVTILRTVEEQGYCAESGLLNIRLEKSLPSDHYFKSFAEQELPNLIALLATNSVQKNDKSIQHTGAAVVQLAAILLRLYVPDKPFDPSLGLVVQRQRHSQRSSELTDKATAIASFERVFSGQPSNIRHDLIQGELRDLGSAPPPSSVTRPQVSELSILHGEFTSVIKSVLERLPKDMLGATSEISSESQSLVNLLRDNIHQLSRRLSTHYRSYDDIVVSAVRFLQILDLGLFLMSGRSQQSSDVQVVDAISGSTPFLGGIHHPLSDLYHQNSNIDSRHAIDMWFHELSSLRVAENADPGILHTQVGRNALRRLFEQFHGLWKAKLREDQEEEAKKASLYQYRGSWEDSEEVDENELRELFPTYEEESVDDGKRPTRLDPKNISIRLASLHANIFQSEDPGRVLTAYVKQSAQLLASLWSEGDSSVTQVHPRDHLSGVLLLLEDSVHKENNSKNTYNFYVDANPDEGRKLVSLTVATESRFLQIQSAWPEHAVLADVILCCKEILQFKHAEPVAKFLTKLEKLHGLVHEWQLVASREYSAAGVYDEITNLIINWRRLELSTWARLLDLEKEKCVQDVSQWWFVAYEAIIGAPVQLAESGQTDLSEHTQEVIATLENFFRSTTLGQYSERLLLVKNFRSLLSLYIQDFPCLKQLVSALDNFMQHYTQFGPPVHKLLKERRSTLEKDIKEQIQLASWKDTNIVALRESAKRSHHKLFKLVRKYREILAQPVQHILDQDMPDDNEEPGSTDQALILPSASFPEALALCQKENKIWQNRPPRFRDPDGTVSNMAHMYVSLSTEFDVSEDLDSFMKYFLESIKEFRSQTPKTLTEENKDDVQHLKVQKRRFYADTLRRLLEMGVKRNASTSLIEAQASVAQVLASSPALEVGSVTTTVVRSSNLYFHRLLDILPRVRQAAHNYSEDLSNVEVSRSSGSVEHLLHLVRKQRAAIAPAMSGVESLQSTLVKISNLWTSNPTSVLKSRPQFSNEVRDTARAVAWLTPILGLSMTVVELHAKFSGINSSNIVDGLRSWKEVFSKLHKSLGSLPELPHGVTSQLHVEILKEASSSFDKLNTDLTGWAKSRPDLSFVLMQLTPWAHVSIEQAEGLQSKNTLAIEEFDGSLLTAIDKILVSLQKLKEVPSLIVSPGSLSRSDEFFTRALKAVHLSDITSSLESVLDQLQGLKTRSNSGLAPAVALVASLLPIMNKYRNICKDLVDRYLTVHRETCKMSYLLAKSFTQIASEGFCTPAEASTEESKSGKLESGTGLGEGQGAEDISNDIGDDEDLSELAQQEQTEEPNEDMDESGDATGEHKKEDDEEDASGDEEDDNIDEEVGSVDDLEETAQKETENKEGKGQSDKEKEGENGEGKNEEDQEEEEEEEEESPDDEGEAVGREEMDVTDPHAKEQDALDLPEEMQLDGDEMDKDEGNESDDGLDDDEQPFDGKEEENDPEAVQEMKEAEAEETNEPGEEEPEEAQQDDFLTQLAPSEAVNGGLGTSGNAEQESGSADQSDNKQKTDAGGGDDANCNDPQLQAFKKMGDILEQWHRRQKEIMEASKQEEDESDQPLPQDTDMADADFEHLADQDDQTQALDQNKGVESDAKHEPQDTLENKMQDEMQLDAASDSHTQERTELDEAQRLWSHYESVTNDLSLSLTEQLRKRLNIKRIIPYIASQYKRDKIWMRRKSILSMLEAGDLCVLGFGNEDHAGTQVFQHFSYQQTARWKQSPGSGNADLWQLELIISDGICEDHETIQRLVRQAQEERIMIVFIIVDAASFEPDTESGTGEMKLKMKRYLEGFPFPYYLVVRDVRELPAVLATALKQWFAEVVDVSS
ncbi:hypothetical protein BDV32DRAFT_160729 [Aspergillus pseudonomiae]|uniref:Midasin n=1 Tax=Aspergillus pseudonomiae TaxID=1506151 RepID=A0A5N6HRV0_9EURO|nr:uncharacterized protein BDV37DRAFT_271245 [Aspergillus pseudonomiae]KAB8257115.1 hypothetical protein BDV32DRAFT_160729 [Aspergillus pseudonomiae]KAE8404567.1 hypothetical protein BDV37DRAFT_271245 [Aspergillus pseudonomiae]